MEFIDNPSKEILEKLQLELKNESNVGIVDIWAEPREATFYVALKDSKPVAVATVCGDIDCPELYKLYVIPSNRRFGVAEQLFNHVMLSVKHIGAEELFVEATVESVLFWNKIINQNDVEHIEGTRKVFFKFQE
ncbi:GNAT family N-acetyltransferase [Aliivibrio sp. S2TY2]|uniref:GNAT family N-acetyltransferase n=1 Tax=Aliivibrio TaxID=511678 RepID=UPI00084C6EB0|nr:MULTISPECIES: GNAT family N-acetyltransferase [Aliivibrio]MDD9177074.1 GNAT family N-acetyltransferase [Aliivibrio sp. S3TY1]MDD9194163.1 GNAT family N-acetyltransferase [Aliivibrio sp. S2TY2]OED52165.1 hypothetical protein BEI46_18490 [Aliivibrio fischeri]